MCKCADECNHVPFFFVSRVLQGIKTKHEIALEFELLIDANSIPFDAALHSSVSQFRFGFFDFTIVLYFSLLLILFFFFNHDSPYAAKFI